ncbi:response regulator transcription factor [Nocardioides sp. SYSU D00038]|uniref:helix-turn-helix transcriptional regulator n=1 Tax=Nocardioides sp. SYSU D00038 TaxID=2812554 RepID=UPI0019684E1C|nr:response regulator transcription factor [Nocardioides sp. SYSU D00038]
MSRRPGPDAPPLAVGVYDEPELIVSGIGGMLDRLGGRARLRPIADGRSATEVDVLLCDPIDREVAIEDYLAHVSTLTEAPVLVFTWSRRTTSIRRALAAGARGYVAKTSSADDLGAALEAVHRGEVVAPSAGAAPVQDHGLSVREAEVLELICRGLSNQEIADELFVSVNSVKTYVRQVYLKAGVNRRAQAVSWGLARGF